MKNRFEKMGRLVIVICGALVWMGCGEWETDPRPSEVEQGEEESSKDASKNDAAEEVEQQEVRHPFTSESQEGEAESEEGEEFDDAVEKEGCASICFKTLWCQEEGGDLETCIESCQEAQYSGIISRPVFDCLEEAKGCVEVARCEDKIEACTEVCGVYNQCGYFADGVGCHQWCAGEVWEGRLDWDVQGCITAAGRADACGDLEGCGLSLSED